MKRKGRKEITENSFTQKQHRKSDRSWAFLSQYEKESELRLPRSGNSRVASLFSDADSDSAKKLLIGLRPSANETFSSIDYRKNRYYCPFRSNYRRND
ncbi:hypothetical protein AVEN_195120-1 [Araneus ventricosus]|uniref:Uncharacterized protein n=1 Tax=Araneus ventricosus TaxID=182803 RepID=A0A4Y2BG91_ARAVE|nr:hypothetical protein AVEN_195120-1 [Araneus ventricosus]